MRSYQFADLGDSMACTLCINGRPVRRAIVSKAHVGAAIARRHPELGWSIRGAFRSAGKALNKVTGGVAKKVVDKVAKPVARVWMKVEEAVRPIGKKIPIVGDFARLHEKLVAPMTRKVFGAKEHAKKVAKKGPKASHAERADARDKLVKAVRDESAAKAIVINATAKIARTPPKRLAEKKVSARKRANVYTVILPSGKRLDIPASEVR